MAILGEEFRQKPIIVVHVNNKLPELRETMEQMQRAFDWEDDDMKIFLVANSNMERDIEFQCLNPVPVSDLEYEAVLEKLEKLEKELRNI